jgi:hypothetical protein
MTRLGEELSSVTLSQRPSGQGAYNPQSIDMTAKVIEHYERELKRVFGSLMTTVAEIDNQTGQMIKRFFVPKDYEQQLRGVITSTGQQLKGLGMATQDKTLVAKDYAGAHYIETVREIKGSKAQQYAREELVDLGGVVKHTAGTANKDIMTTLIPVLDSSVSGMTNTELAKMARDLTPMANKASIAEQSKRTKDEHARLREEQLNQQYRLKRQTDRENARKTRESERAFKSEQREKLRDEIEADKEKVQSRKALLGKIGKVATAVGVLVDITRRILTSVLTFGSEVSKSTSKARTLETSYIAQRNMNYMDVALGMEGGTSLQAQEDLRAKFGNTAKIDTEALKWLAMVMGNDVGAMVQSGLGGDNPAKLMESIIDSFYERWGEGKDQYGNVVGQDKARRALVTLLESVSPSLAKIFERMIEEQTNGLNAGRITSYGQLQKLYLPASGGLGDNEWERIALLGKEADELKATFKNLGEILKGSFLLSLQGIIGWANGLHLGETTGERFESELGGTSYLIAQEERMKAEQGIRQKRLSKYFGNKDIYQQISLAGQTAYLAETDEEKGAILSAQRAMAEIMEDPQALNELKLWLGTAEQLRKVKEDIDKGRSPDKAYYSLANQVEVARIQAGAYLDPLGYSEANLFSFAQQDFIKGKTFADLMNGFTFSDIAPNKQGVFKQGALDYLDYMTKFDFASHKKSPEVSGFKKALEAVGLTESQWREYMQNPEEHLDVLMSLVTKIVSGNVKDKVKKGGLNFTKAEEAEAKAKAMNFITMGSDEFGLNREEWARIRLAQQEVSAEVTRSKVGSDVKGYTYEYRKGNAGQIEMIVKVVDNTGKVLQEYTKTVAGTLDQDFKETINGSLEKLSK